MYLNIAGPPPVSHTTVAQTGQKASNPLRRPQGPWTPQSLTKLMCGRHRLSRVSILRRLFEPSKAVGAREGRADASLSPVSMTTDILNRGCGGVSILAELLHTCCLTNKEGCKEFSCAADPGGLM